MSQTNRSSQVTLVGSEDQNLHTNQLKKARTPEDIIFGCYKVGSLKTSDLECADVPERTSSAAYATKFKQAYKAYQFQIKSVGQNGEYLMLDVTEDSLGYIFAAGDGHCWHMRTLLDFDEVQEKHLQRFVSFTAKHSIFIARHELVKVTMRTFSTQKKFLFQHYQTYLSCITNTKVLSFNLLLQQIYISDDLIKYLICQAFHILKVLRKEKLRMFKGELINHLHIWAFESQKFAVRLGSCTNGCDIPSYEEEDKTTTIYDDFLKIMIQLKPDMTDLIESQRALNLKKLKSSSKPEDLSKVQEQLEELFATSVIVTVEQKTSQQIYSNKRPP